MQFSPTGCAEIGVRLVKCQVPLTACDGDALTTATLLTTTTSSTNTSPNSKIRFKLFPPAEYRHLVNNFKIGGNREGVICQKIDRRERRGRFVYSPRLASM